eukprot:TRINITY_DN17435_c0_g1_i1.p1 TRINITY_DN17435_c0_g1~~TRINITY_DN17435_c0_g1_i1.p1  ORF type:complete len:832 (+),score=144.90 TRINITY_DN17435_c0_g1_i1:62-2557(+)
MSALRPVDAETRVRNITAIERCFSIPTTCRFMEPWPLQLGAASSCCHQAVLMHALRVFLPGMPNSDACRELRQLSFSLPLMAFVSREVAKTGRLNDETMFRVLRDLQKRGGFTCTAQIALALLQSQSFFRCGAATFLQSAAQHDARFLLELCKFFADENEAIVQQAQKAICKMAGGDEFLQKVLPVLAGLACTNADIRGAVMGALSNRPDAQRLLLVQLFTCLEDEDTACVEVRSAIQDLFPSNKVLSVALPYLEHREAKIRCFITCTLRTWLPLRLQSESFHDVVLSALSRRLMDTDPSVREAAISGVGKMGRNDSLALDLLDYLSADDIGIREAAVKSLSSITTSANSELVSRAKDMLLHEGPVVQVAAAKVLRGVGADYLHITGELFDLLGHRDKEMRCRALRALEAYAGAGDGEVLRVVSRFKDPEPSVRCAAVDTLSKVVGNHDRLGLTCLAGNLEDEHRSVRDRAGDLLSRRGFLTALAVSSYAGHDDSSVRRVAVQVLTHILKCGASSVIAAVRHPASSLSQRRPAESNTVRTVLAWRCLVALHVRSRKTKMLNNREAKEVPKKSRAGGSLRPCRRLVLPESMPVQQAPVTHSQSVSEMPRVSVDAGTAKPTFGQAQPVFSKPPEAPRLQRTPSGGDPIVELLEWAESRPSKTRLLKLKSMRGLQKHFLDLERDPQRQDYPQRQDEEWDELPEVEINLEFAVKWCLKISERLWRLLEQQASLNWKEVVSARLGGGGESEAKSLVQADAQQKKALCSETEKLLHLYTAEERRLFRAVVQEYLDRHIRKSSQKASQKVGGVQKASLAAPAVTVTTESEVPESWEDA